MKGMLAIKNSTILWNISCIHMFLYCIFKILVIVIININFLLKEAVLYKKMIRYLFVWIRPGCNIAWGMRELYAMERGELKFKP